MCMEGKVALLLGKVVEGVSDSNVYVLDKEEVGECIMYWIRKW